MIDSTEILLLDDNDDTNYYNRDIIEDTYLFDNIIVFTKPLEVLNLVRERIADSKALPGVFIVDIKMPEMDGFEFLDEMDELTEGLEELPKVFILSTSKHKRDREQFDRSFLARAYINKPLSTDQLIEILKK